MKSVYIVLFIVIFCFSTKAQTKEAGVGMFKINKTTVDVIKSISDSLQIIPYHSSSSEFMSDEDSYRIEIGDSQNVQK